MTYETRTFAEPFRARCVGVGVFTKKLRLRAIRFLVGKSRGSFAFFALLPAFMYFA